MVIEAAMEWNDLMKKRLEYDGLLTAAREKWTLKRFEIILDNKIYFYLKSK